MHGTSFRIGRREVVQAGALGLFGGFTPRVVQGDSGELAAGFGRAKACILLFMWGGPSHLDTLDPKPQAPDNVRGEFGTIATRVPGVRVAETMPLTAGVMDRLALIRSLTHDDPAHLSSAHATVTGHLAPNVPSPGTSPPT